VYDVGKNHIPDVSGGGYSYPDPGWQTNYRAAWAGDRNCGPDQKRFGNGGSAISKLIGEIQDACLVLINLMGGKESLPGFDRVAEAAAAGHTLACPAFGADADQGVKGAFDGIAR
jgi:hypothetical protein